MLNLMKNFERKILEERREKFKKLKRERVLNKNGTFFEEMKHENKRKISISGIWRKS